MIPAVSDSGASGALERPENPRPTDVVRALVSLGDALQRLGYSYEAYQLHEAARRLMLDLAIVLSD